MTQLHDMTVSLPKCQVLRDTGISRTRWSSRPWHRQNLEHLSRNYIKRADQEILAVNHSHGREPFISPLWGLLWELGTWSIVLRWLDWDAPGPGLRGFVSFTFTCLVGLVCLHLCPQDLTWKHFSMETWTCVLCEYVMYVVCVCGWYVCVWGEGLCLLYVFCVLYECVTLVCVLYIVTTLYMLCVCFICMWYVVWLFCVFCLRVYCLSVVLYIVCVLSLWILWVCRYLLRDVWCVCVWCVYCVSM